MGTATSFQPAATASHLRCHLSVQQTQPLAHSSGAGASFNTPVTRTQRLPVQGVVADEQPCLNPHGPQAVAVGVSTLQAGCAAFAVRPRVQVRASGCIPCGPLMVPLKYVCTIAHRRPTGLESRHPADARRAEAKGSVAGRAQHTRTRRRPPWCEGLRRGGSVRWIRIREESGCRCPRRRSASRLFRWRVLRRRIPRGFIRLAFRSNPNHAGCYRGSPFRAARSRNSSGPAKSWKMRGISSLESPTRFFQNVGCGFQGPFHSESLHS